MTGVLTLAQVQEARQIAMGPGPVLVQTVLAEVAHHSGLQVGQITSRCRTTPLVRARSLVIRAAFHLGASVDDIAQVLDRDRTTIVQALNRDEARIKGVDRIRTIPRTGAA